MATFGDKSLEQVPAVLVTLAEWKLSAKVYDDLGNLVANYTGANALPVLQTIATLPAAQQKGLLETLQEELLTLKSGVQ